MARQMHSVFSNLIPKLLSTLQPRRPTDCNKEIDLYLNQSFYFKQNTRFCLVQICEFVNLD